MKKSALPILLLCLNCFLPGCKTEARKGPATLESHPVQAATVCRVTNLPPDLKSRILSLDPGHVTESDVRDLLSRAPAPRIISIHGGILPIKTGMNSFSKFLIGMGYPEASIRRPENGSLCYGYYDRSDRIAATVAWYYEQDGLRPMIIGHSQGGIQAVRVLHRLAGGFGPRLEVWNPLTGRWEERYEITDPLSGTNRPVVGLKVSFATAAVSGGLARLLPNTWNMNSKLREIPDSVEEFTGFQKGLDLMGGDFLGYGPANEYRSTGSAKVRNVRLPSVYPHSTIPYAKGLLNQESAREWIRNYHPGGDEVNAPRSAPESDGKSAQVLWAAEVWYSIKKHWVLELQQLIRAQYANSHEH